LFGAAFAFWAFDRKLRTLSKQLAVLLLYCGICAVQWSAHVNDRQYFSVPSTSAPDAAAEAVGGAGAALGEAAEAVAGAAAAGATLGEGGGGKASAWFVGVGCAALAGLCSAACGTFTEAVLKGTLAGLASPSAGGGGKGGAGAKGAGAMVAPLPPSLWLANARLSLWGSLFGLAAAALQDGPTILRGAQAWRGEGGGAAVGLWRSFFRGYNRWVWLLVGVQSAGGLVISGRGRRRGSRMGE
jgi:hypothetical protein